MTYFRKVIHIRAEDSPNVAFALAEQRLGRVPSDTVILPGQLTWLEYQRRRATWDKIKQTISLDGQFYEGGEILLCPPDWLDMAHDRHRELVATNAERRAVAMGVDTAEGGDNTAWAITDELGLMRLVSAKTSDTSVIVPHTIALMTEYRLQPDMVMFDRGGGGKQHADNLVKKGYNVSTVQFGESVTPEPVRYLKVWEEKQEEAKDRMTFKNRRAYIYWLLRMRLDPHQNDHVFAIPDGQNGPEFSELRRQLAPIPIWYDGEGRFMLPPKRRAGGVEESRVKTIQDMIGCSPDESDALALALYAMDPSSQSVTVTSPF